jgi:hypothetical protein
MFKRKIMIKMATKYLERYQTEERKLMEGK